MKMMGMSTATYWTTSFVSNAILMVIINAVVTVVFSVQFGSKTSLLNNTDPSIFFLILIAYALALLLFCFTISILFRKGAIAITVAIILDVVCMFVAYQHVSDLDMALPLKLFSCLMPCFAYNWANRIMTTHKLSDINSQWNNVMDPPFGSPDQFSLGIVMIMMLVSIVFYSILILYLDAVWPWQPGIPKSPLFCFYPSYWRSRRQNKEGKQSVRPFRKYFEEEPDGLAPNVIISHVTKVFKIGGTKVKAVDDVFLNIYPGQITALLGHNGAGKTTVMNILTGLLTPTKGTASINGYDILKSTESARRSLGLCPQHNVLYDNLTVEEHLKLFAGLKGIPWSKMNTDVRNMIEELDLHSKRNTISKNLSEGMKRKLSLGNAIIGGSQVLILDEPTSGLDLEARQAIWNILIKLRPERAILLTTHYMEEADVLGDRIAIMANGSLKCCGSPMYLKREYGTGYHLCIEKGTICKDSNITEIVQRHIPEANILSNASLELLYSLSPASERFSALFEELENSYETLGIASFGITITTMEDVFMKVGEMSGKKCDVTDETFNSQETYHAENMVMPYSTKPTQKLTQQMQALFMKRYHHAKRHLFLLVFQVVMPLVAFVIFVYISSTFGHSETDSEEFSFDLDAKFPEEKYGFYYLKSNTTELVSLAEVYSKILEHQSVKTNRAEDPVKYLLQKGNEGIQPYVRKYLIGGSFSKNEKLLSIISWYSNVHYHLAPMSINLMTNSLLRYLMNDANTSIHVTAQNFPKSVRPKEGSENDKETFQQLYALIFIPLGLSFMSASFILLPIHERVSKAKLLQRMCGVRGTVYWLMNLSWDFLIHAFSSLFLLIPFIVYHGTEDFTEMEAVGAIYVSLLIYGLPSILLSYFISFIPNVPSTGFALVSLLNCLIGIIIALTMSTLTALKRITEGNNATLFWTLRLFPNYAVTRAINSTHILSKQIIKCQKFPTDILSETCSNKSSEDPNCCIGQVLQRESFSYLSWDENSSGKECLAFILSSIICGIMIISLETFIPRVWHIIKSIYSKQWYYFKKKTTSTQKMEAAGPDMLMSSPNISEDSGVFQERQRIEYLSDRNITDEEALVVCELTKSFGSLCAVNNLTFGVHREECFGLLGINGAGKTTVFRMLAGDLFPTAGNAHIGFSCIQKNINKFQTYTGYCPQYNALIDQLNGRETLQLFANLRGVAKKDITFVVNKIITMCDLQENADKPTKTYSGGTKRKLSLAIALIGTPPVVLLDEPTAGVDPVSRRKIWKMITQIKELYGVSFILTSHSMEECEYLCNRIAIMVNGELCCVGAMQNLKTKFGEGYTLIVKLQQVESQNQDVIDELKSYIKQHFPSSELKVQHQGTLQYHITDISIKWSTMFSIMEDVKQRFQLEDYVLSGITLEQIFMAFARTQKNLA